MAESSIDVEHARFCELLIATRRASGLTQVDVANRLDKPQSFVSKYERGERRLDVIEFLHVASALNADPRKLISQLQK